MMMHRLFVLFAFLFVFEIPILAQENEEEEPLPPPRHAQPKIGGAAGFTQNLLFLNLNPINDIMRMSIPNAPQFQKAPLFLLGGQGYGYILVVPNLRIGGMGAGGSMSTRQVNIATNVLRDIELSASCGGVTIDYVVPIMPRLDVAFGVLLGGGGVGIKLTRDDGRQKVWSGLWNNFGSEDSSYNFTRKISGSFFVYQPSVNVEFAVLRWVGLRLGVGYQGTLGGSWRLDDRSEFEVVGVPNDINGRGFMINGGIFLGTFIF